MLLRGAGDRGDLSHIDGLREPSHHDVEGFGPHQRRRHADGRIPVGQEAVLRAVLRQCFVEAKRGLEHDAPDVPIDLDDDGGEALRARVEPQIERHARLPGAAPPRAGRGARRGAAAGRARARSKALTLQVIRARPRVRTDGAVAAGVANLREQRLNAGVTAELLRLVLEDEIRAHAAAREVPHAFLVLGAIRVRVEVARTVVARLLEQLDEKEERLDRLRREAQILIEPAGLLIVEIDVKQLAGLDRLRHGMEEVQSRHLLVRQFRVDADHLRVRERRNQREVGRCRGKVDVAARLVRLGFQRESQGIPLIARVLAQEIDGVTKPLDRLDRDPWPRRLRRPRARPRTRRCARQARPPDPSPASSSAARRPGPAGRVR